MIFKYCNSLWNGKNLKEPKNYKKKDPSNLVIANLWKTHQETRENYGLVHNKVTEYSHLR